MHRRLKTELATAGVKLAPLMLVQVASNEGAERARTRLLGLGFTEREIAVHTAEEPDAGLLALANDEEREVLIFKLAVALGFDAPRAFTLVSMRASRDTNFGVQLVGRILRVHRRLQGRKVPETLRHGYAFLADAEAQTGLDAAGQRINGLRTAYAKVTPTTALVMVVGQPMVQVLGPGGQTSLSQKSMGTTTHPGGTESGTGEAGDAMGEGRCGCRRGRWKCSRKKWSLGSRRRRFPRSWWSWRPNGSCYGRKCSTPESCTGSCSVG